MNLSACLRDSAAKMKDSDHHGWSNDVYAAAFCIEELAAALRDMCDNFEEASQYKGEYLAKKHGDADELIRARATLARWGLENERQSD